MSCSILHAGKKPGKPHVLVFSKTAAYHHASISYGIKAIQTLGIANGFDVDTTADASWFTEETLKLYAAVVFMSTTHEVLDKRQQAEFERYIQAGGGYVGVHAAVDGGYTWPWYGNLALGQVYGDAGTFVEVQSYEHVQRWTAEIAARPAVKRGRMVNRLSGNPSEQLHERQDASDFETKTEDKIGEKQTA